MPKLIIKLSNQQDQLFELDKPEILIGRGEECDLILPNISISRVHAKITIANEQAIISDLNSGNGISINNENVQEKQLISHDEIFIGTFALIYLGDKQEDKFYRGRAVIYLPKYNHKKTSPTEDITFKLSAKDVKNILKEKGMLHNGCIIDSSGRKYFPEANPMTFGKAAMIRIEGWFTSGNVATIQWDGKRHIIEKHKWLVSMSINGRKTNKHALKPGDKIQLGRSHFNYSLDEQ